jgi:hypothetical protein
MRLLEEKVKCPSCIFLQKGNHELVGQMNRYGFMSELRRKFGEQLSNGKAVDNWKGE